MSNNNNRPIKNKNESIKYKQENNNAIPFFNQGMKLFDNIKQKITQEFSRGKREGYENGGILGPNTGMQNKISGDKLITDSQVNAIGNNLAQYSTGRDNLTAKTTEYLDTPGLSERNYNLFINELPNPDAREITKCVSKDTLTGLSDDNGRFLTSYPLISTNPNSSNFSDFSKAKEACKTWAVDSNEPIFALTRDANSMFNCHVGSNNQSTAPIYTKPDFAYNLTGAESTDANSGGLFANGLIGVFKNPDLNIITKKVDVVMTITNTNYADSNGNVLIKWLYEDGVYSDFEVLAVAPQKGSTITKTFTPPNRDNLPITGAHIKMSNNDGIIIKSISFNGVASTNVGWLDSDGDSGNRVKEYLFELKPSETTTTTMSNTENIKYFGGYNHNTNDALSKYIKCDKFIGGDINTQSITASYGRNCSNIQVKPLTARYVKVKMMKWEWLQMSQLAIWGYENGKLTNLAYKCRTNQPGTIRVKSFWRKHRHTGDRGWSNHARLNYLVDGKLKVKSYGQGGYHAGYPRYGEGFRHDFVLFDLGASYPITKIVYYNRGDCCQYRANGMQINLYTTQPPISGINQTDDGGLLSPPITLTSAAVQEFNVKGNTGGGGGESYVDCSSHTEITPSMPAACRDKLLEDANTYKVVSKNNGSVNCNTYCRGTGGNSWNNEMPNWEGAKCVAGGNNYNKACSFRQGSQTKCICKREDSLGWN